MKIHAKLAKIQANLKSNKNNFNKFGGYKYRTAEGILESVKPLLDGLILVIKDEIININNRFYVKATATVFDENGDSFEASAFAREADSKKGMDDAQVTGASSSYARKYALCGLFAIDDSAGDPDNHNSNPQVKADETPENVQPAIELLIKSAVSLPALQKVFAEVYKASRTKEGRAILKAKYDDLKQKVEG